jgi:hypothetical protein
LPRAVLLSPPKFLSKVRKRETAKPSTLAGHAQGHLNSIVMADNYFVLISLYSGPHLSIITAQKLCHVSILTLTRRG